MKKLGAFLLGVWVMFPVYAQDPAAADAAAPAAAPAASEAPAAEAAPADQAAASPDAAAPAAGETPAADAAAPSADAAAPDAAPATAEAPATGDAPPADTAATEPAAPAADATAPAETAATPDAAAPAEAAAAEAAPAETAATGSERKPLDLYFGYDHVHVNTLISNQSLAAKFGADNPGSSFHQIRAGVRLFDVIGLEAHYGIKGDDGSKPGTVGIKNYAGIYFAPTGTVLETVEISALLGYARMDIERPGASISVHGSSYGVNLELPIRRLWEALPDVRLGGGVMVYHRDGDSRSYGSHFGARFDFKI
jgi:hypothetical protein